MIHLVTPETGWEISDVVNRLDGLMHLGLDTETTGLEVYSVKLVMLQIGDLKDQYIIDCRKYSREELRLLLPILTNKKITKYLVNAKFDYKIILHNLGIRLNGIVDVMLQDIAIWNGMDVKHSLKAMSIRYLGINFQQDLFDYYPAKSVGVEFLEIGDKPFTKTQISYGANDVIYALAIANKQKAFIAKYKLEGCVLLENNYVKVLAEMEYNGFYIDTTKWMKLYYENMIQLNLVEMHLLNAQDINWRSPKQVSDYFRSLGIPVDIKDKHTGEVRTTVGEEHLSSFKKDFPIIPLYLSYKKYSKYTGTYGLNFLEKYVNPVTKRLHSSFWQFKHTGRISSARPNLQNIPSPKAFRKCFSSQWEDTILGAGDYSNQEARVLADMSSEPKMLEVFNGGDDDMHSATASVIYKRKITKANPEERDVGKMTNFLMAYGGGPDALALKLGKPRRECVKIIKGYYDGFSTLTKYFKKGHNFIKAQGFVIIDPITNRRYYPGKYERWADIRDYLERCHRLNIEPHKSVYGFYSSYAAGMERTSQNYPVQGLSASMSKLAAIYLYNWQLENDLWDAFKIVNMVHDEIVLEIKRNRADEVMAKLEEFMIKAGEVFCKHLVLKVGCGLSTSWEHD
jgi:DNA polymerase-1